MSNKVGLEYKSTFNLASAAGQLISTIDKMNPPRATVKWADNNANFYRPVVAPIRTLSAVAVTFSGSVTQTFTVSIVDNDGVARVISSLALAAASNAYFEPEHDISIGASENFQVDITASGSPAITGTIVIFTQEG